MNPALKTNIENLGFLSADSFIYWQLTRYLHAKKETLEAQIRAFEEKHQMDYPAFETQMLSNSQEVFEQWDDSIEWEVLTIDLKQINEMLSQMEKDETILHNEADARIAVNEADFSETNHAENE